MKIFNSEVKVENMTSAKGNKVPNQIIIRAFGCVYFQSYDSIIVEINASGHTLLDKKYWDYSKTTSKCRNSFLGETKKETQQKIDSGEYELTDLNK